MIEPLAASIVDALLGLELGPAGPDAGSRLSLEGLVWRPAAGGALEIGMRRLEAASLRLASGPLVLEVGRLALHQLVGEVRGEGGRLRLHALEAVDAELSGVKVHGPVVFPPQPQAGPHAPHPHGGAPASAGTAAAAGAWNLAPLAAADGRIGAEIVDAHLLFDADVDVPIRHGQVNFNDATVAHVGPDSRMGVSRLGLYVDAPNGRSYLYQFTSAPVAGVEFERRGALPGPWVSDRGRLRLREFGEGLLRQGPGGHGLCFTDQARLLFDRTAVSGEVQLGDGMFAAPGVQAEMEGRSRGRNAVRVHSAAVGRELTAEIAALSVRQALVNAGGRQLACDQLTGALRLRVFVEAGQLRFAFECADVKLSGLRLQPQRPDGG